jgi:putative DNA primase/helicase
VLNAVRPDPEAETVVIVEGTKQAFSVASHAAAGVAVYGIAGCRAWSEDGRPISALRLVKGKKVVVVFDADFRTNPDVWEAGQKLAGVLEDEGAAEVRYAKINAAGQVGIDDMLAAKDDDEHRRDYLDNVISKAEKKLPARPKAKPRPPASGDEFFAQPDGLRVHSLSERIREGLPAALTAERKIALYRNGYYNIDGMAFSGAVGALLGDRFRPTHRAAAEEYTAGLLYNAGLILPTYVTQPLLNVANGMLHLPTDALKPHDAVYMSAQQVPVSWDPDAKCPTYERWVDLCGVTDQIDDLEESISMMLDPSRTPHRAVFLYGPSRSGKSTMLRLMQAMVGERNFSAVTLHQLADNRFAAANVFGMMLNCAADLSSAHVEDLSIFKMMTGEDPIQADRKFGNQFAFTNRALFAFSANNPPTVGEGSRAYTARIKPFKFPISFEGHEDPAMEEEMLARELPGILVRWVRAWQRRQARGAYLPTRADVASEFETRSDRVRQFIHDRCTIHSRTVDGAPITHGTTVDDNRALTKAELAKEFNDWADDNQTSRMGRSKIIDRVVHLPGVVEVRRGRSKTRALNITVRSDGEDRWEDDGTPSGPGGSFEAPGGSSGAETATDFATADQGERSPVAEVAVSTPPVELSERRRPQGFTESNGSEGSKSTAVLDMAHSGLETATSATRAIARPALDRVERAMTAAGAVQPSLLDGDAPQSKSTGPLTPRHRTARPGDAAALGGNSLTPQGSPVSALLPDADLMQTCPRCRGRKQLVPPTYFWMACPACYKATFGAQQ